MTRIGTLFMTLGLVLIGLSGYLDSRGMLYAVLPVAVIGFSAVTPSLQSLLSRHTSASEQGGVLGLGQSIAALARILGPMLGLTLTDRNIVWPYWAGGALMGVSELETVVRLGLPMVIVVYDDEAYGAEVHHFRPNGHRLDTVTFPPADIAQIGRGFGCDGVTVRGRDDLAHVSRWLDGPRDRPLVVDAKVTSRRGSWWLEEAFRGH